MRTASAGYIRRPEDLVIDLFDIAESLVRHIG
jgi:hypothetical protein